MRIESKERKKFSKKILKWFRKNKRNFPWRETDNPYEILIAEILLQRTKAPQVEPVYRDFLRKFPSPEVLAKADVETIGDAIYPLGLKKRSEMLKEMGQSLVSEYDGKVPTEREELMKLKGVGFYTASAVRCLAYEENEPMVDWNVSRIFERIWSVETNSAPHTDEDFIDLVSLFVLKDEAKQFNLALLDFSAKVCKPRNPVCDSCPFTDMCDYYRRNR